MIAVGLVLIGFVVYELWVTSYFARRAQSGLQEQFRERAATVELETVAYEDAGDRPQAPLEVQTGITAPAAAPGQPENAVLSGHRTTCGAPFCHLDVLEAGDLITIEVASGTDICQVVETVVVEPTDTWVTEQWDGAWLTLTTCSPRFSASRRLVVVARLVAGPNAAAILAGL
jgi:sortase A